MSRLYLALAELEQGRARPFPPARRPATLPRQPRRPVASRHLRLRLAPLLRRPALVSPLSGWKRYPLVLDTRLEGDDFQAEVHLELTYSSTCPCSAALARQLIQERFDQDFAGQPLDHASVLAWLGSAPASSPPRTASAATRTCASAWRKTASDCPWKSWRISASALGTAVQTAVKRADEQAFAPRQRTNLMFCEDAVPRAHTGPAGLSTGEPFSIRRPCGKPMPTTPSPPSLLARGAAIRKNPPVTCRRSTNRPM